MTNEQSAIWREWRRMHYRGRTLIAQLEEEEDRHYGSLLCARLSSELDELNRQMSDIEDENEWLPPLINEEFGE